MAEGDKYIETVEEHEIGCPACPKGAVSRVFVLKDSRPYKVVSVTSCSECGHSETTLDDYETLPYGVRITCQFGESSGEPLNRMAFVNSNSTVTVLKGSGKTLFSFKSDSSNVDCLQGLLMRGREILETVNGKACRGVGSTLKELNNIIEGAPFGLVIEDESGFSKVCPAGKEYADVQEADPEALGDEHVRHEKTAKQC